MTQHHSDQNLDQFWNSMLINNDPDFMVEGDAFHMFLSALSFKFVSADKAWRFV